MAVNTIDKLQFLSFIEIYGNTYHSYLSKLEVLITKFFGYCRMFLVLLMLLTCINVIIPSHCTCYIIVNHCYLYINLFTIQKNYHLCLDHILLRINIFIIIILAKAIICICIFLTPPLGKGLSSTREVKCITVSQKTYSHYSQQQPLKVDYRVSC